MSVRSLSGLLAGCLAFGPVASAMPASAQEAGDQAPELHLESLLQAPPGVTLVWERAPATVIEFWGTWCAPCAEALPHLNRLVDHFSGRGLRVISITDEPVRVVEPFLAKKRIAGWVGLDTDRSVFDDFGIRALPRAVLVNSGGRIAAVTDPRSLTQETLEALLDGRPLTLTSPKVPSESGLPDESENALLRLMIRKAQNEQATSILQSSDSVSADGVPFGQALSLAYDIQESRTIRSFLLPDGLYDLSVALAGDRDYAWRGLLRDALRATFGVSGRVERRATEVLVLDAQEGAFPGLTSGEPPFRLSVKAGEVILRWGTMEVLAHALETALRRPVLDETGIEGSYNIDLRWEATDPDSAGPAIAEQLGLRLTNATREIDVLVLSAPGATWWDSPRLPPPSP